MAKQVRAPLQMTTTKAMAKPPGPTDLLPQHLGRPPLDQDCRGRDGHPWAAAPRSRTMGRRTPLGHGSWKKPATPSRASTVECRPCPCRSTATVSGQCRLASFVRPMVGEFGRIPAIASGPSFCWVLWPQRGIRENLCGSTPGGRVEGARELGSKPPPGPTNPLQ
jgi:hypothetical protein